AAPPTGERARVGPASRAEPAGGGTLFRSPDGHPAGRLRRGPEQQPADRLHPPGADPAETAEGDLHPGRAGGGRAALRPCHGAVLVGHAVPHAAVDAEAGGRDGPGCELAVTRAMNDVGNIDAGARVEPGPSPDAADVRAEQGNALPTVRSFLARSCDP